LKKQQELSDMSEFRMWAEDPVSLACSVVELPEILAMEARTNGNGHPHDVLPPLKAPVAILGVPFSDITLTQTIERIEQMITSRQPHYVVTANVDFLVQAREDVELRRILFDAHHSGVAADFPRQLVCVYIHCINARRAVL